jgi:hypothetical protein
MWPWFETALKKRHLTMRILYLANAYELAT